MVFHLPSFHVFDMTSGVLKHRMKQLVSGYSAASATGIMDT